MEEGVPVKFDFDLSKADFTASGNDLVIVLPHGGAVVLERYLALAGEDALPVFEMSDGQFVPGGFYLFAFAPEMETAADGAEGASGAGTYADTPDLLGDGLDALDGQDSLFSAAHPAETTSPSPLGEVPPPAADEPIVYPEFTPVQIVLNPGFEASGYTEDRWSYLDDVNHWHNPGAPARGIPEMRPMTVATVWNAPPDGEHPMKIWGTDMPQTPRDGSRLMELDAGADSLDALSQAIATKAGEAVTIAFNFTPRAGEAVDGHGMETNDFRVTLGDQLVATVTWDADHGHGAWLVSLGPGVATADHGTENFHFGNQGVIDGHGVPGTDWTELSFTLTADRDHAPLIFSEFSEHNDGYGTLIDAVTVFRGFDTHTTGGESDTGQTEYLTGTDGDDAIFGAGHAVVDGVDETHSFAEVIDGGAGDDALYGGQNFLTVISGGAGDDFMVAGRPLNSGLEESHDTGEPVGQSYILPGSGNDYVRLGQGSDAIILNRDALVDGEKLTVENFTPDNGETFNSDHIYLADGLACQGASYTGGDLHLLVGDGSGSIEITLKGIEPAALDTFLHTGPDADTINDQIQALIDSGSHTHG
jgi:hypothetical protein